MTYEKILALFREHYPYDPEMPYFDAIMIGVAPGGFVSVWVTGLETREVFIGQAEKVDINPIVGFALPFKSKEQSDAYIAQQLVNVLTAAELEFLKNNGVPFGTWARYRNLYKWAPTYKHGLYPLRGSGSMWFLNGEKIPNTPTRFSEEMANTPRPLPRKWSFSAAVITGQKYVYEIEFDEFELMSAFEKLGEKGERVNIVVVK